MRAGTAFAGLVVAAIVPLLALGACGLPDDSSYRPVARNDVPFNLLEASTTLPSTTLPPTTPAPESTVPTTTIPSEVLSLYFVLGGRLARVDRTVPRPVSLEQTINVLLGGPFQSDQPRGVRTSLPEAMVSTVNFAKGVATVDLTTAVNEVSGREQILAIAQLVATLTARPNVGGVAFTLNGRPVDVPRADGSLVPPSTPLVREDFTPLLPVDEVPPSTTAAPTTPPPTAATTPPPATPAPTPPPTQPRPAPPTTRR